MTNRPYRRPCARCGKDLIAAARFPDGHICYGCLARALKTLGRCPGCGHDRQLIGRLPDGAGCCRDCAGITRQFSCRRCGYEGQHCRSRLCARCALADRLDRLLDDGTGQPNPALAPLAAALRADPHPDRALDWVTKPRVQALLTDLATGRTELAHTALAGWPQPRTAAYVRDLLITCGALTAIDKQLLDYQWWLHRRLAGLAGHPHLMLLRQYGLWHQLAKMRAAAATRPLRPTACQYAQDRFRTAQTFLTWLHAPRPRPRRSPAGRRRRLLPHPPARPAPRPSAPS